MEVVYRRLYAPCPQCGYHSRNIHDRHRQKKLDIPLHGQTLILLLLKRRFRCPQCGKVFTEPDEACGWRRRTTERLRHELYEKARHQTVKRVARHCGVGERFVRESFARYASEEIKRSGLAEYTPVSLGMDDFSVRKGQRYQTLFCDLQRRRRLAVVEGRDREAVQRYLNGLAEPEKVAVVTMDMSEAYRSAVELCLPQAEIVADKMHVVALVNRALDKVRLRVQGQEEGRTLYEGRYLLLRNPEELDRRDPERLAGLLRDYPALRRPWQLKEESRRWYREADPGGARLELRAWEREVEAGGPMEHRRLLPTIASWREEILNYFRYGVTNGYLEGSNNRTKVIRRQAYGYHNKGNLRLRILLPKAA